MTITEPSTNGHRAGLSDEAARERARADYRTDRTLTGRELGERYPYADGTARSEEWGRKQQRAVRDEERARTGTVPSARKDGTGPGTGGGMPTPVPARRNSTASGQAVTVPARRRGGSSTPVPAPEPEADLVDVVVRPLVTGALTGIALLMSYSHMRHLAVLAGVDWPMLLPLAVDLLMVSGWLCLRRHPWYPLAVTAVVVGVVASLGLNAIAARLELADLDDVRLACALAVPSSAVLAVHLLLKR